MLFIVLFMLRHHHPRMLPLNELKSTLLDTLMPLLALGRLSCGLLLQASELDLNYAFLLFYSFE